MKVEEAALPGVLIRTPAVYRENRGAFMETWNQRAIIEAGLPSAWLQDNFSVSKKNVLRGIHYQLTQPHGKLVRVTHGAVLDVVVDLRRSSPAFGQHVAVELEADSGPSSLFSFRRSLWSVPVPNPSICVREGSLLSHSYRLRNARLTGQISVPIGSPPFLTLLQNARSV